MKEYELRISDFQRQCRMAELYLATADPPIMNGIGDIPDDFKKRYMNADTERVNQLISDAFGGSFTPDRRK